MTTTRKKIPLTPAGKVIARKLLDDGLFAYELAEKCGLTGATVSKVMHGHIRITPEIAVGLEKGTGRLAEHWIEMQFEDDRGKALEAINSIRKRNTEKEN